MTREIDLVSYLPPFVAEYKEINAAFEAENPEFVLVWNAVDKVLRNEFIETADEEGIARFEKLLQVLPSTNDTLESRRARVQARWFSTIPYTLKTFIAKLTALCGNTDFSVTKDYLSYRINIRTSLELFGQVEELKRIIEYMLPCNMVVISENEITCEAGGFALICGGVCAAETFLITNDFNENFRINGKSSVGSGVVVSEFFEML